MNEAMHPIGDDSVRVDTLSALEAEIPILAAVRRFVGRAMRGGWFSALGEPLDPEVEATARAFLDGLGFPHAQAVAVLNWEDALDAAASCGVNSPSWEAEEQLRADAVARTSAAVGEQGMGVMLAHLAAELAPLLAEAAEEAVVLADALTHDMDDNIIDLMVGAGQQAVFGAAWAVAAAVVENEQMQGAGKNPLFKKYQLFEAGHWPLGVVGQTLNLF